jgi:ABC-type branched-subunit amino acid transport system substrate-binding protein
VTVWPDATSGTRATQERRVISSSLPSFGPGLICGKRLSAALVTPLSGPLARYGRSGATALRLWAEQAGVDLAIANAYPSAAAAIASVAVRHRIDVLFGPYGAGPTVAAAHAAPAVLWNHGGASARLVRQAFPHVVNIPAPAATYLAAVIRALDAAGLAGAEAVLLHSRTGFGREVAGGALEAAGDIGLAVTAIPFSAGDGDGAAGSVHARRADVLLVAGGFDDELAIAARLLRRRWRAAAFVAAGVDEVLAPVAGRLTGVYGPCQWLPDAAPQPEDGPESRWFTNTYLQVAGSPPPYPAAAAFAAGVLWQRCTRDAGDTGHEAVQAAAEHLTTTTLFGAFRLDPATGLQKGHRVGVVQWRRGRREIITPPS